MDEKSWHKSHAPGVPPSLTYDQTTVSRALSRSTKNFPNHSALNYMGRIISYKKLESMVNAFARVLTGMGIKPDDKVAVCLPYPFLSPVSQKTAVPVCKIGDV